MPPPSIDRIQKLMSLGTDPPNDREWLLDDLLQELRARGLKEQQLKGIELAVNISFRLGEKNACLKIARGEEVS